MESRWQRGWQHGSRIGGRGAVRETAILRATLELLAESGYDQLTIDAVAERARCSKATIYRRWGARPGS